MIPAEFNVRQNLSPRKFIRTEIYPRENLSPRKFIPTGCPQQIFFLGLYKIIHISSTVDAYASKCPVKLLRVSGHILRSILANVIFDRVCYIGRELCFDIENANNITPCYGNPGKLGGESWHKSSYLPSGMFQ